MRARATTPLNDQPNGQANDEAQMSKVGVGERFACAMVADGKLAEGLAVLRGKAAQLVSAVSTPRAVSVSAQFEHSFTRCGIQYSRIAGTTTGMS